MNKPTAKKNKYSYRLLGEVFENCSFKYGASQFEFSATFSKNLWQKIRKHYLKEKYITAIATINNAQDEYFTCFVKSAFCDQKEIRFSIQVQGKPPFMRWQDYMNPIAERNK